MQIAQEAPAVPNRFVPRSGLLGVVVAGVFLLAPPAFGASELLPVVASTTVVADFVRSVGGNRVVVRPLAPAGADPHTFQPTPDSMQALASACAAFFNGSGLEEWWGQTVRSVGRKDLSMVELSKGLATIETPGHTHGVHSHNEGSDPHVWLDPVLVKQYADRIREALSRADTAGAASYAERAKAYQAELDALDAWIRAEVEKIPAGRRKIVTFHNAFQYFVKRYGLTVRGFVVASPGQEPSAKALADLVRRIKTEQVPAVFIEADFNPKLLETLGRDAGVKVVTNLYDGSLTDGPPADSYLSMMRHNVTTMVNALR